MTKNRDLSRSRSTSDSGYNADLTHWFFLDGENQHGPFSVEELRGYFDIGALAKQTLLWHSGMPEWLPVDQVEEFAKYSESLPSVPPTSANSAATPLAIDWSSDLNFSAPVVDEKARSFGPESSSEKLAAKTEEKPAEAFRGEHEEFPTYESVLRFATGGSFDETSTTESKPLDLGNADKWKSFTESQIPPQRYFELEKPEFFGLNRKALMAVGIFGGIFGLVAVITAFQRGSEPAVFSQVSKESNFELKNAFHSSLKADGPRVAVGLSTTDVYAPQFIVGSNLPDGQKLEVAIDGVAETLVDRFKVSVHTTVVVKNGVALTPVFRQDQGIPYPSGSYRVRVSCPDCETIAESASSPLADKVFPVNTKNVNYEENLNSYHKKLRAQAKDELTELKQVSETLESQLNDTETAFQQISSRKNAKAGKRDWTEFNEHWTTLQRQLDTLFARWTPTALDGGYFYAGAYSTLKKAGELTSTLHEKQNEFILKSNSDSHQMSELSSLGQKVRTLLEGLKAKVHQLDETLPNSNGMPPTLD